MHAIETSGLTKAYGNKVAVRDLGLNVGEGEIFSLLGVNGAGKTTAIRMLSCLTEPTAGDALVFGHSIRHDKQAVKRLINVSPQETAVASNLTVRENLELFARLYGCGRKDAEESTRRMLDDFSLSEVEASRAGKLSGGWQRRLSIAMALISEPKLLFLDEPTLGLDILARRMLWETIASLKGKMTVILTTHYLEEAEALSDRIGIMVQGSLRALGTAPELKRKAECDSFEDAFIRLATDGGKAGLPGAL